MNFITKNLKQAGIFNATLIIATLIFQVYQICVITGTYGFNAMHFINNISIIIALISGLCYAFYGYKKTAAKYYKAFMILTLIAFVCTLIPYLQKSYLMVVACLAFARIIPLVLLTFKKDFGKKNSVICAYITFALTLATMIIGPFFYVSAQTSSYGIALSLSNILLAAIIIVFVEAKYADKEARGAK